MTEKEPKARKESKPREDSVDNLVPMTKGGEVIHVHPDNVGPHVALGWAVVK